MRENRENVEKDALDLGHPGCNSQAWTIWDALYQMSIFRPRCVEYADKIVILYGFFGHMFSAFSA